MHLKRLVIHGLLVTGLLTGFGLTAIAHDDGHPPSTEQIAFAQRTSDLLLATLFAALTQEFDETTVRQCGGGQAVHLAGVQRPEQRYAAGRHLRARSRRTTAPATPSSVPRSGLRWTGQPPTAVQRVDDQWFYRRSIPLSNFRVECALCHTNFPPAGPRRTG